LNAGSITSGFGSIDLGTDTITTTGTISTDTLTLTNTGTLNGLDAIDATGEATLESTLDIGGDVSGTGLGNVVIGSDKVLESHLKAVDAAGDEECLTYETTTGDFEWQLCDSVVDTDDQNLFETFAVSGQSDVVADSATDTFTLAGGTNITITTNASTDTITIAATDTNTTYAAGNDLDLTGTTFDLESTLDIVSTINLAGTGTLNGLDAIDATGEATLESTLDIGGDISGTGLSSVTIGADKVLESHLKAVDAAGDEECLTYETTTGDFEWQVCDSLGSSIENSEIAANTIDWDRISNATSLDADTAIAAGAGEEIAYNKAFTDATGENGFVFTFTASDTSSGTTNQFGVYLDNVASSEGVDASLVIDNSDEDDAVAVAIKLINAGGGFTNLFDVAGTLISITEFTVLDGGITYGELTDSGTLTVTTADINGGAIDGAAIGANSASTGAFTSLSSTGATTIGNNSATVAINSNDWDISTAGALTGISIDFNGSGNSGSNVENADLAANTLDWDRIIDASALDADTSITAGAGEDLTFAKTFTNNTTENGLIFNFTASDTGAATTGQYGLYLDNLASTEGLDASLVIDNSDSDDAVVDGILFAGNSFTDFIDTPSSVFKVAGTGDVTLVDLIISGGNINPSANLT
ncbi:MAG: hypothetical protein WD972_03310, partial [Candidatus Andersenbacteria bacterium]